MANQCLNSCCFCCTLETGGFVIGWINIIFGFLGFIGSIIGAVLAGIGLGALDLTETEKNYFVASIVVFCIYAVFALIYAVAGIFLVQGTRRSEHRKIVMMLILMGIGVVLAFLNLIIETTTANIVSSIIGACIQLYFFTCIYSLYAKIKNQNEARSYS